MNIDTRMIVIASIVAVIAVLAYMLAAPENTPGGKVAAPPSASAPAATSPATSLDPKAADIDQPSGTSPSTP